MCAQCGMCMCMGAVTCGGEALLTVAALTMALLVLTVALLTTALLAMALLTTLTCGSEAGLNVAGSLRNSQFMDVSSTWSGWGLG